MPLFILKKKHTITDDWDEARGFVIRAWTRKQARMIAADNKGDEDREIWLDPELSTCKVITGFGKSKMILKDYHAG